MVVLEVGNAGLAVRCVKTELSACFPQDVPRVPGAVPSAGQGLSDRQDE